MIGKIPLCIRSPMQSSQQRYWSWKKSHWDHRNKRSTIDFRLHNEQRWETDVCWLKRTQRTRPERESRRNNDWFGGQSRWYWSNVLPISWLDELCRSVCLQSTHRFPFEYERDDWMIYDEEHRRGQWLKLDRWNRQWEAIPNNFKYNQNMRLRSR